MDIYDILPDHAVCLVQEHTTPIRETRFYAKNYPSTSIVEAMEDLLLSELQKVDPATRIAEITHLQAELSKMAYHLTYAGEQER